MNRHGLRGDQFARVENLLPGRPGHVGRDSEFGNRLFVEAVIWKFRTGVPWRDMPARLAAVVSACIIPSATRGRLTI
jgi:transposase